MVAKSYRMPRCVCSDQRPFLDTIHAMRGDGRACAEAFLHKLGPQQLCVVIHAMRRWYSFQTYNAAKKILPYRRTLGRMAMDLDPPLGAYRGFKVDDHDPIAELQPGDVFSLSVRRNGGCSSWTMTEKFAHRFSGASRGKVGIIVRLADGRGAKPFIAPPSRTEGWFNRLYRSTMGSSFRFNEQEYAIYGKRLVVEVHRIKRR